MVWKNKYDKCYAGVRTEIILQEILRLYGYYIVADIVFSKMHEYF